MPFILVNQSKVFYIENKIRGTPLVFIHGWLGSSFEWIHQFCYFNSKEHIIMLDLPGYGKSDKPKIKYSVEFFTNHILDFLKLLKYNEIILIGHSLGGLIAQNIILQNQISVKKLILISTPTSFIQSKKEKIRLLFFTLIFKLIYKIILKMIIRRILSIERENRDFRKLYNNSLKIPKSIVLSTFKTMTSKFCLNKDLIKIFPPTLIIYGDKDPIINKSQTNEMDNLIPSSEIAVIKNCTHRVMVENHIKINKLIENFITK
ncbi:MAG: alpha/beta fold hydrolase [Promethearchaeota archaeon]